MAILEITSRDFRDKQRAMFDLADQGAQIVIRRGNKRAYILTPLDNDTIEHSLSLEDQIAQGLENISAGNTKRYTLEELRLKMGI